jgi:hypothetical protein
VRNRTLLSLALLLVLALPVLQTTTVRNLQSPSPYTALADASTDATGGHSTGATMRVAPTHPAGNQYRAGQSRGTLPTFIEIFAALLSAIRLL